MTVGDGAADLHEIGAGELATRIRKGVVSSEEATRWQLERATRLDPQLRCFVRLDVESALQQARAADDWLASGRPLGPLHGVPLAVKENIAVRGLPRGDGMPSLRGTECAADAHVTQRLRQAGAVLLGTLAMSEGGWSQHHPHELPPVNPRQPLYSTSGSSSGPAVAVSAGLCHAALGTDTGGSVRQPAAACGVYGLKPTWGRVSTVGVTPMSEDLDHVGLLTRKPDDLALLLSVLSWAHAGSPAVTAASGTQSGPAQCPRIAVPRTVLHAEDLSPASATALSDTMARLRNLGWPVQVVETPSREDLRAAAAAWLPLCAPAAWAYHAELAKERPSTHGSALASLLAAGRDMSADEREVAKRQCGEWRQQLAVLFESIDILVLPVSAAGPLRLDAARRRSPDPAAIVPAMVYTAPFNLSGHPALAVPVGSNHDGAPVGVQLVAKPHGEQLLIDVAIMLSMH